MISKQELKEENKHWHQDHLMWMTEIKQWQNETERLVALLYLLERALPEHSAMMQKHTTVIADHEKQVCRYESSMEEDYLPSSPESQIVQKYSQLHQKLANQHASAKQQHLKMKQMYLDEIEKFKSLIKKLLNEC